MTKIAIQVSGGEITAQLTGVLTAGMRGIPVTVTWGEGWEQLIPKAVFQAGNTIIVCPATEQMVIPWEVLTQPGFCLNVGFYGISEDGSTAIPTLWAKIGQIQPGADPEATPAGDPALPMWKQAVDAAAAAQQLAWQVYDDAQKGVFNGYSPVLGLDYWTERDKAEIKGYVDEAILGGAW